MSLLIGIIIVYFIGWLIRESDEDKQWKDKAYQRHRLAMAKLGGYDATCNQIREKYHKKYGYAFDPEMKGQPFDIGVKEYYANKMWDARIWKWDRKEQRWIHKENNA